MTMSTSSRLRRPLFGLSLILMAAAVAIRLLVAGAPSWLAPLVFVGATLVAGIAASAVGAGDCSAARPDVQRRYTRAMVVAMAAYAALLIVSLLLLRQIEGPGLRALVALLPVPPIALVLHAMIGYIRDIDELQQRIELEAICIAAAGVSLAYMTGGFLQGARVIDVPASAAMLWVFPAICGVYGLAKLVVARRYR
ncbi:hypothetical protein CMZ82_09260 [Lysobacteraceae bacterium NML93-0792]|nr:hypothetical protein CMZ82_09260 [Xanthomonadaceae bacterium NML93-0792]PBS15503.1 hypothetical protein CMZ81_10610 [Xanthomonadaceae bacterium NML93-0793]PBS20353.1 hypothetical protein CMZ80_00385 [Xanthomonadaceae bacterium NML93-0831]